MHQKTIIYLYLLFSTACLFAQTKSDSIIIELRNIPLNNRMDVLKFARTYFKNSPQIQPEEGIELGQYFLDEMDTPPRNKVLSRDSACFIVERILTRFHGLREDKESALESAKRALSHAKKCSNRYAVDAYLSVAYNQMRVNNYFEAIDNLLLSLEISDTTEIPVRFVGTTYEYLSNCYNVLENYEESNKYSTKALDYYQTMAAPSENYSIPHVYFSLMQNYRELSNIDSTNFYSLKLIDALENYENDILNNVLPPIHKIQISSLFCYFTNFNLNEGKLEEAKKYYKKINDLNVETPSVKFLLDLKYALKNNDLEQAGILINQSLEELGLDENGYDLNRLNNYKQLYAEYYAKVGDMAKSIAFSEQYHEDEVALLKKQQLKFKEYLNGKLEGVKQQKDIETLEIQQKNKTRQNYFLIGLLFTSLLLLGTLYYAFQQLKKKNNLLDQNLENKKIIEIQSKKIQQAQDQKNKLFTNITHEFQTPLSIIKGLGENIYNKEQLSVESQQALNIIIKNSQQLSKMTNELLAANIGINRIHEKVVNFSLSELFQYLLPEYNFLAKEKNINLTIPKLKEEVVIISNIFKIETVLRNLLSNAIKNTPNNGNIDVKYTLTVKQKHQLQISDNGHGIAENDLPFLFDRYYQPPTKLTKGGFGLGLAICKEFLESLGGTIQVESKIGKGSTFSVEFPNVAIHQKENDAELYEFPLVDLPTPKLLKVEKKSTSTASKHLLIVEDNKDFCQYLNTLLKDEYQLTFTHNGQEALNCLIRHSPDLILTDWMMPLMDGQELVAHLKSNEKYVAIPVLMLTARSLVSDKHKMLRIGIDDYLNKIIDGASLKQRIQEMLTPNLNSTLTEEEKLETTNRLSLEDQKWLIDLENQLVPLIGNFDLDLGTIATAQNMHPKQLSRKIKALTGFTAKKYIQEIRLWEARRLIETKEAFTVKSVSLSIGYKDSKYFSQKFKDRFGENPSTFLKNT